MTRSRSHVVTTGNDRDLFPSLTNSERELETGAEWLRAQLEKAGRARVIMDPPGGGR